MGIIYLIGESHSVPGKNLLELGLLKKIEGDYLIKGISFELETKNYQHLFNMEGEESLPVSDFRFLFEFARQKGYPIYASDKRDFSIFNREIELEEMLGDCMDEALIDEYREVARQSLEFRDRYTAGQLDQYAPRNQVEALIHICGLSHLRGLKKLLIKKGHTVRASVIKNSGNLFCAGGEITHSLTEVIGQYVSSIRDNAQMNEKICQKWAKSFARFREKQKGLRPGSVYIDYENNPYIAYINIDSKEGEEEVIVSKAFTNLKNKMEQNNLFSCALPNLENIDMVKILIGSVADFYLMGRK